MRILTFTPYYLSKQISVHTVKKILNAYSSAQFLAHYIGMYPARHIALYHSHWRVTRPLPSTYRFLPRKPLRVARKESDPNYNAV